MASEENDVNSLTTAGSPTAVEIASPSVAATETFVGPLTMNYAD
jgi:hypothetical protein